MTPEQFTYWLQGFMEMREDGEITEKHAKMIKDHLDTVFHKVTSDSPLTDPFTLPDYLKQSPYLGPLIC